jgi:hypothetical protein
LRQAEARPAEVRQAEVRTVEVRQAEFRPAEVRAVKVQHHLRVLFPPPIPLLDSLPDEFNVLRVCHAKHDTARAARW